MDLSIVIPCFDEAERIDACLDAATRYVDSLAGTDAEIVVVDDGSRDGTAARVSAWRDRRRDVRLVRLEENRGKGEAVRRGVAASVGEVVVFLDADLAVDVAHVGDLLPPLRDGVDVAVGCRHVPGASVTRPQGLARRALGRGYLSLSRWFLGLDVSDVTCGFKGFRRRVAERLFEDARSKRWGFDAEILFLAARENYRLKEVPVSWRDGDGSKVRLPGDLLKSFGELVAVRWRAARGVYGRRRPDGERGPR
jgi:glycosyltransferase involved in cell wall biosynthesis